MLGHSFHQCRVAFGRDVVGISLGTDRLCGGVADAVLLSG